MPITPDTKDWTWVLDRACPECGFDASTFDRRDVAPAIRRNAAEWPPLLAGDDADVRRRPSEDRWSLLEYACHVRDVFRLYEYRLQLMLDQDDPGYPNWDQDETAVTDRYAEQDPGLVAKELVQAAEALAARFDAVSGDDWSRTGNRSDGARFSIDSFSRYLVHDPIHHLWDVTGRGR